MRIVYDIDSKRPGRGIAITIDLTTFSVSKEDIFPGLSLSPQQLTLAQQPNVPTYIEGGVTTLYYPFGAVRVQNHVISSTTQLLQQKIPWTGLSLREEDSLLTISPVAYDLTPLSPIKPLGRVITLAKRHRLFPAESFFEVIQVHMIPNANRRLLQYRYGANDAYGLALRLAKLDSFVDNNIVTIGNAPLRSFF